VRRDGALLHVDVADDTTYDVVRDAVADLALGLVRLERQRHRMTEIFTDQPRGAAHV
jgi:ABC-2 type transport system ATP-binding protein